MARYVLTKDGQPQGVVLWDGATRLDLAAGVTLVPEAQWSGPTSPPAKRAELAEVKIRTQASDAIEAMQAHIDRGTFTAQQTTNALLLVLRVCVALTRLVIGRLDDAPEGAGGAQAQGFASMTVAHDPDMLVVNAPQPLAVLDLMAGRKNGSS